MLERARATSLALLGATAAVGLAIVALALNQSWPVLEGNPIPAAPKQQLDSASVVARAPGARRAPTGAAHRRVRRSTGSARSGSPARTHATVEAPSGGEEAAPLVVSQEAPASSPGGTPTKAPPRQGKVPGGHSQPAPSPTAQPPAAPPSSPPAKAPAAAPEAAPPAPTQPEAVASEAPLEESNVPPWSQGKGHAYGRDEEEHGHGWGDGGDWHGH